MMSEITSGTTMGDGSEFYLKVLDTLTDGVYFVDRDGRITFWNRAAEVLTGFTRDQVLGTRCSDGLLCHVSEGGVRLCEGGCPLRRTMEDGRERSQEVYFRHASGHRVPVTVRASPLRDETGRVVGAVEVFSDNSPRLAAVRRLRDLEEMAFIDPLTGLGNRRAAERTLVSRHQEMTRYGWHFGILFVDLDRFKDVNDRYGHAVGDDILKMVAKDLEGSLRVFDFAGRWGGEEFIGIVVHVDEEQLLGIAERFRMLVEESSLSVADGRVGVTVSIGATLARPGEDVETLIQRADALMYDSKQAGRNRVSTDGDPGA
jgi:diguanylate cyclase (GGDEF)-like protein/PAS domain S-box-containing protein